jgi:hypothetical protein
VRYDITGRRMRVDADGNAVKAWRAGSRGHRIGLRRE